MQSLYSNIDVHWRDRKCTLWGILITNRIDCIFILYSSRLMEKVGDLIGTMQDANADFKTGYVFILISKYIHFYG